MNLTLTERDKKLLGLTACLAILAVFGVHLIRPALAEHEALGSEYEAALQKQQEYQAQIDAAFAQGNIGKAKQIAESTEFAKMAVILFLPWVMEHTKGRSDSLWFMTKAVLCTLPIAALVGSNNLSTAIILLGICAFLIFISHPGYLPFLGIGGAGIGFIAVFLMMESYRLERLAIWRNPEAYEKGFQTIQGLYAIGSGRIFGCGLGKGLQKLGFVPEAQNDMIFSIICEEGGLFGACLVIAVFAVLIWRLMVISIHARDLGGALIAGGIMGHIALQVILNIAVVTNTIPNTGITLPFISYGGTSVLFLLGEMGLALAVSRDTD